jgi:hypothetical protein
MSGKKIILILSVMVLCIASGQAKRCNSCCPKVHCSLKEKNELKNVVSNQGNEISKLKQKTIHLHSDIMMEVYDSTNRFIGYILDEYNPDMIGKTMKIVPRIAFSKNAINFFADKNMRGVFTSLTPGKYTSTQISLPIKTISSISIPENIEVVLYSNDNFTGKSILVKDSVSNLVEHGFNDQVVSIEIIQKDNTTNFSSIGKVFYNTNFNGKSIPLTLGFKEIDMHQIRSLKLNEGYEMKVFQNSNLVDIVSKNASDLNIKKSDNGLYTFLVSQIDPNESKSTIVVYKDIDYNCKRQYIIVNNQTHFNNLEFMDTSISSIKIPDGLHLQIFENSDFTGASIYITGDIPNLKNYAFNDRMRSFIVVNSTVVPKDRVVLYSKTDYNGEQVSVPIGYTKCDIDNNDLNGFCRDGYNNARASSIFVPEGYKVVLEKKPLLWEDKTYHYTKSSSDIRNWIDTAIVSIDVKKI